MPISIYADTAELAEIIKLKDNPVISGFTTNSTLMKMAGIANYELFAREAIKIAPYKMFSFEVISDDLNEMYRQAKIISSWGKDHIYVKIPITNTRGNDASGLIKKLCNENVKVNVTCVVSIAQAIRASDAIQNNDGIISVFAGRIADAGHCADDMLKVIVAYAKRFDEQKILWASVREIYNLTQAMQSGCHIITITPKILKKLEDYSKKPLEQIGLEVVKQFYNDGKMSGYTL